MRANVKRIKRQKNNNNCKETKQKLEMRRVTMVLKNNNYFSSKTS